MGKSILHLIPTNFFYDDLNKSINLIRSGVTMPALTNSLVSTNGLDMRGEIRRERTVDSAWLNLKDPQIRN